MKLLVVDDSQAMRMIIKRTLRAAGFGKVDTVEAANGREALDVLGRESVDVVLSDWNMPEMNGFELLEAISEQRIPVKFGFVTTEATPEMRHQAKQAGARFLIAKPFTPETFERVLGPVLG